MRRTFTLTAFCAFVALASQSAFADIEVTYVGTNPYGGFPSTGGTGMIDAVNPNGTTLDKTFTSLGDVPIIIDGGPVPTAGMDTIRIFERVRNNTGVPWTDFHLVVDSIDSSPNMVVDFLNVTNSTGEFTNTMVMPGALWFLGNVPHGDIFSISFDVKVTAPIGGFYLFGIHETPSIPEPTTLLLATVALIYVAAVRRYYE